MAENTCNSEKCAHALLMQELGKLLDVKVCYPDACPNFIQNWFNPDETHNESYLVNDCAPKRQVLMQMQYFNRSIGVQKALEQQRNVTLQVISKFNEMIDRANERLRELPNGRDAQGISRIELPEAGGSEG